MYVLVFYVTPCKSRSHRPFRRHSEFTYNPRYHCTIIACYLATLN